MSEVLRQVLINPLAGWLGFLGFALLAFLRWRVLIPLLPMLALGLLGFQTSRRFIMFLAPLIGVGLGFLLSLGLFWILEILRTTIKTNELGIENQNQKNSGQPESLKILTSKKKKHKENNAKQRQKKKHKDETQTNK